MTVRYFKPKGNGDVVQATDPYSIANWRKECDYYEIDVNGNKLPDFEGLVDFWNSHAAVAKAAPKKAKE